MIVMAVMTISRTMMLMSSIVASKGALCSSDKRLVVRHSKANKQTKEFDKMMKRCG